MESQDLVSVSDKPVSENEGIELQVRISSDTLPSDQNDPGSVTEHLQETKSMSDVVSCTSENDKDKDKDISSTESRNVIEENKSEAARDESRNVSVEKEEPLYLITESSNMSTNKEKSDVIPVEVHDMSKENDLCQAIRTEALAGGEKFEPTSNESGFSTSTFDNTSLSHKNKLASSDNLIKQLSDGGNVSKYTEKASQTFNSGTTDRILPEKYLQSMKKNDTEQGNLQADADSISEKRETHGTGKSKNSGATTKNTTNENVDGKYSADSSETTGGNVTKEHIATKVETLHLKEDENVTEEQLSTVGGMVSSETVLAGTFETEPPSGETEDDTERKAFFYMSSCSVPGMGKEWEWPSVSSEYHYQRPTRRMQHRRNTSESRSCLRTQRCHYIILAVGVLGAILGCLTYHLQDYGIGPKVLRPIGASAAFLSFVVCAFSSVYLTYLSYYTQSRSSQNYQPLDVSDPVASMLINTMPQGYNSDPRFYFTSAAAATAQQVFRESQSADALDRRGYSWQQTEIKRPFDEPGPSGYDPDSKRFKMDPSTKEVEAYKMRRISEKDKLKERNPSQASDSSLYVLADQVHHSNSDGESENGEKTPLLPKK